MSAQTPFRLPTAVETVTVAGATYVIVAGSGSSSLTVLKMAASGALTPVDHVLDEGTTRFSGVSEMAAVTLSGRSFLIVGGADDGLSLFTVLPDGRLVHLHTIEDRAGLSLQNVSALAAAALGGRIAVFAASETEAGISQFEIDPGPIGATGWAGAGDVTGTGANDLLMAQDSTTVIRGGGGDDILVSGRRAVTLVGGAGSDTFIPTAMTATVTIADFNPAEDRIDLSNLGFLRSTHQLTVTATARGLTIRYGTTVISVLSHDGTTLQPGIITDALFPIAHYPAGGGTETIIGTEGGDIISGLIDGLQAYGLGGNDTITGSYLADNLNGGPGRDTLIGGLHADRLYGEDGDDIILAGEGNDRLWGQAGDDTLNGGIGDDTIMGGVGNDRLLGDVGNDVIDGEAGDDIIFAHQGNDYVAGGTGDDIIYGEGGDDTLLGNDGNDLIVGGAGNDRINSGGGKDTVHGADGNDTITGGPGQQLLNGGAGNDLIFGGSDADRISGEGDNDLIYAMSGNDHVQGGSGMDTLKGGEGNDTLLGEGGYDALFGGAGNDICRGGDLNDKLWGEGGDDQLWGDAGNDRLEGGAGRDSLIGGQGADLLIGGADADVFIFTALSDSWAGGGVDTILDFTRGIDRMDLRALHLTFVGSAAFSGTAGQLRVQTTAAGCHLQGDLNGDGVTDLLIAVSGTTLGAGDLLL